MTPAISVAGLTRSYRGQLAPHADRDLAVDILCVAAGTARPRSPASTPWRIPVSRRPADGRSCNHCSATPGRTNRWQAGNAKEC